VAKTVIVGLLDPRPGIGCVGNRVEHHSISNHPAKCDNFLLNYTIVFVNNAVFAKGDPVNKIIKLFTFTSSCLNLFTGRENIYSTTPHLLAIPIFAIGPIKMGIMSLAFARIAVLQPGFEPSPNFKPFTSNDLLLKF